MLASWRGVGQMWIHLGVPKMCRGEKMGNSGTFIYTGFGVPICERPHSLEKHTLAQKHFAGDDDPNFFCSHLQTQRFYVEMCRNAHIDAFLFTSLAILLWNHMCHGHKLD